MKNILRAVILVAICIGFSNINAQPGCPAVSTAPSVIIPCGQTCTTLNATAFSAAQTTSYRVDSIAYNPPFAYDTGVPVLIGIDDRWSEAIPLPFNFCFFGNVYDSIVVGSNGVVSFNMGNASTPTSPVFNNWSIPGPIPFAAPADLLNCIMGPWQDLDPTKYGFTYYQIGGTYPCRYFEVSWFDCPMFGDSLSVDTSYCSHPMHQTQQIVIYETTNAIEIYLQSKDIVCTDLSGGVYWNGGLAIEGIQDNNGNWAAVNGRNATQWTAFNDAYRFTPNGAPNYSIAWLSNAGIQIGTGASIQVCPPDTGTYTAVATYTNCDNSTIVVSSTIFVGIGTLHNHIDSIHQPKCHGDSTGAVYASISSSTPVVSYGWSPGGAGQLSLTGLPAGTYIFTSKDSTGCSKSDTVSLTNPPVLVVTVADTTVVSCTSSTTAGALIAQVSGGTPGYAYGWSNSKHTDTITGLGTGLYSVTVTDSKACSATGSGRVSVSIHRPSFAPPVITNASCNGGSNGEVIVNLQNAIPPLVYVWSGTVSSSDSATGLSAGSYRVTVTDSLGCSVSASYAVGQPSHINIDSVRIIPVTCFALGDIFVRDTGGTGTLVYVWPTATVGDSIINVPVGIYTLIVTDTNHCADTSSFTVGLAPGVVAFSAPLITNVRCNGDSSGAITATTTGGSGPIHYHWSYRNDSTATITGLVAGTYAVTASDSTGCSATAIYTVSQPTIVAILSDSIKNVSCKGGNNGCIIVTANGGTGAIMYHWSNNDSTATNCGLTAGRYGLTITDSLGCSAAASYSITEPTQIIIDSTNITPATCLVGGGIIVTASGGTGTLTFHWSNAASGDTLANLAGGPISVTITDQNGCSISATDTITAGPAVVVFGTPVITNVTCSGDSNGCIAITTSGGTGPIRYRWSNTDSTSIICGLRAGNYSVTITDSVGCSASTTYIVSQPFVVSFNPPLITNVTCSGDSNGCITVSATGGTGLIKYRWNNSDSTATICGLAMGTYTVTATDSLGCTATTSYNVTQPSPVIFGAPVYDTIKCNGDSTGGVTVVATGGTGPIHYVWSAKNDSTATITGLPAGAYTVTATDSLGCSASMTYNIAQPLIISVDSVLVTQVTCAGGGCIILHVSGGTGTLHYTWSSGATGDSICGLQAGTYLVTITDQNGCSAVHAYTVFSAAGTVSFGPDSIINVLCFGGNTGSISASATGGTGAIRYHWSYQNDSTATITGLVMGTYNVTITDSAGCSASTSYQVTQPNSIVIDTVSTIPATCQTGGCILITASGGNGPYTFHWSNSAAGDSLCNVAGGPITVTATDQNLCTASATFTIPVAPGVIGFGTPVFSTIKCHGDSTGSITVTTTGGSGTVHYHWSYRNDSTATISGLIAGNYTVTASDSTGCSASFTYTLIDPQIISVDGNQITQATCLAGGCIKLSVFGGTGQLIYHWSNGGNADSICGLAGGTYTVTISDQNGCSITASYLVPAAPGTVVFGADSIVNDLCHGGNTGSITASASGGTGLIRFHWNYQNDSTAAITGLAAGAYTVTITDSVGCSASTSYSVTQPNAIAIDTIRTTQATCQTGGCIVITSVGGVGTVTYAWSNSATGDSLCGLAGGPITVTATDQNGCTSSATFTIPAAPNVITFGNTVVDSATCNGLANGSIAAVTGGGTGTIHYKWSYQNDSTATITGLPAGTYSVTVSDATGCSGSATYIVGQPPVLAATLSYTHLICFLATDGSATVTATGGTPGYRYKWNNTTTNASDTGLSVGTVSVTVTDSKGCTTFVSAAINQRPQINSTVISKPFPCHVPAYGSANVITTGGVPPLSVTVPGYGTVRITEIGADTSAHFDSLPPGQYPVSITDSVGCTSNNIIVIPPSASDAVVFHADSTSCNGASDGRIVVTVLDRQNGPFGYSINGSAPQADSIFNNLPGGIYTVVVNNQYGCTKTFTDTVLQPGPGTILPNPDTVETTVETSTPILVAVSNFKNPVYTWSPADGLSCTNCATPSVTVTAEAVYTVTVSDSLNRNCAAVDTVVVLVKGQFFMPNAFTPNGDGKNDEFGPIQFSYATVKSFRIYNRWGQLVHDAAKPWDGKFEGKDQPSGTYLYYIVADHYDQYDYTKIITEKHEGTVSLIR